MDEHERTRRMPCESTASASFGACDSTTSNFQSEPVQSIQSTNRSHLPTEHSEDSTTAIKMEPLSSPTTQTVSTVTNFSTAHLHSHEASDSQITDEKPRDSTFPDCVERVQGAPPAYSPSHLSTNNVLNYSAATPHLVTPQQSALDSIAPYVSLPVSILGTKTRRELALILDPDVLMTNNWRMMAECMDFSNREITNFERTPSPTDAVIQTWSSRTTETGAQPTIGDLMTILNRDLERSDVITDIPPYILKDAQRHLRSMRRNESQDLAACDGFMRMNSTPSPYPFMSSAMPPLFHSRSSPSHSTSMMHVSSVPAMYNMSTFSYPSATFEEKPSATNSSRPVQVQEVQPSEPELLYDAFVLCNMEDKKFVIEQFLPKVEVEGNLKLCLADRDMPVGDLAFDQLMNYMFKRSKKLVVILSDEFFESREHDWQSNLAISQDPASRTQRIIPVKYKKITKRNIFDHLGCCDLTRTMEESWFWDKIINGIKA